MHKKNTNIIKRYIGILISIAVLTGVGLYGARASALVETDPLEVTESTEATAFAQTEESKQKLEATREAAKQRVEAAREAAKQRVEVAREEAKQRLEIRKENISQRLDTLRKERCDAREERINRIITKASEQSQKHLEVLQSIEAKVTAFHTEKQLTVVNYESLQAVVDENEAVAIAALETSRTASLDCDAEGAERELGVHARSSIQDLHVALRAYRTAIKDLIVAVRQAHDAAQPVADQDTSTTGEGQ